MTRVPLCMHVGHLQLGVTLTLIKLMTSYVNKMQHREHKVMLYNRKIHSVLTWMLVVCLLVADKKGFLCLSAASA